jgi:hypothetical protein
MDGIHNPEQSSSGTPRILFFCSLACRRLGRVATRGSGLTPWIDFWSWPSALPDRIYLHKQFFILSGLPDITLEFKAVDLETR